MVEQKLQEIEDRVKEAMRQALQEEIQELFEKYINQPDRFDDCKKIIDRLGPEVALGNICCSDNIDLYLYTIEKYNIPLTEKRLADAIVGYVEAKELDVCKGSKIIDFILEEYPECCTYSIVDLTLRLSDPSMIKQLGGDSIFGISGMFRGAQYKEYLSLIRKIRKVRPGFYSGLYDTFKLLYTVHRQYNLNSTNIKDVLEYLIGEGFRPEYYSTKLGTAGVLAPLKELPSLRNIAKNVMGVNNVDPNKLPVGLFE